MAVSAATHQNKWAVRSLTAICSAPSLRAILNFGILPISAKITAAATTRVFMTAAARRFVAEETILPGFRRPCFINSQRTIIKRKSIESANGAIRFFLRLHCNKAEPARFAGEFILNNFDV